MTKKLKTMNKFFRISILFSFFLSCTNSEIDCKGVRAIAEVESYIDCLYDVLNFDFKINNILFKADRKFRNNKFKLCLEAADSYDSLSVMNDLINSSFNIQLDECDEVLNCMFIIGVESEDDNLILKLVRKEDLDNKIPLDEPPLNDILNSHDTLFNEIWKI